MRLALDTNAYVAFCKGEKKTVLAVQGASALYLPFICLGGLCFQRMVKLRTNVTDGILG